MHFGIEVVPFGHHPKDLVRLAKMAEAAGWEALWVWDHVYFPYTPVADPWICLTAVAAATQKLRLVTGVAVVPRYPVQVLGRLLASLDAFSDGRLILGAGIGAIAEDFTRYGGEDNQAKRADTLDEGLAVLAQLWKGEPVSFPGEQVIVQEGLQLRWPNQQARLPVWIGGDSQPALRRAACWDGWIIGITDENCRWTKTPERLAEQVAYLRQQRKENSPFEVVIDGVSEPGQPSRVAEYESAGATWWFEAIHGMRASAAELEARVKAGPPV